MTDSEIQKLRGDRAALESALTGAGVIFHGKSCRCPFHDDRHASAGIYEKDGVWKFKCHSCQVNEDVIGVKARLENRTSGQVLAEQGEPARQRIPDRVYAGADDIRASFRAEAVYAYANPDTRAVELAVARVVSPEGKKFFQFHPVPGGFGLGAPAKPWPLYNRTRVRAAETVWVVEGEKCVHAMADGGVVATTSPGGALKAHYADWTPLSGKKVVLWPDNDPAGLDGKIVGIEHMKQVMEILQRLDKPPRMFWIDPAAIDLPEKGDVADYLEPCIKGTDQAARSLDAVQALATPCGGAGVGLDELIEDTISGKRASLKWSMWPAVSQMARALMPGTVTAFCGDPGSGKSFMLLEAAWRWHQAGVKVAIFELEDAPAYHLNRSLAQIGGESGLMDDEWIRENAIGARALMAMNRDAIDSFGANLYTSPEADREVTLHDLLTWIDGRCKAGCRVIIIDPITAAGSGEKSWIEDRIFVIRAKGIMQNYGASLILCTHPKLGTKGGGRSNSLDSISGGSAYPRFSHTVLWLVHHKDPKTARVNFHGTPTSFRYNRSLRISKARNGAGAKAEIAYMFSGKTLCFEEGGRIIKDETEEESPGECPI